MTDMFSTARRSEIMRAIKGRNTKPELLVRSMLHSMGYRYRLHVAGLPGKPDLVFSGRGKVIFIHGCFWHGHTGCKDGRLPKSNLGYWAEKLMRNKRRDCRNVRLLRQSGWSVAIVWECQLANPKALSARLKRFLGPAGSAAKEAPRAQ